jgi:hypothetical protein
MRAVLLLLGTLLGTELRAQVCTGNLPFAAGHFRLYGLVMFGPAQVWHGGAVGGGKRVFGGFEVGMSTTFLADAMDYAAGAGVELSPHPQSRFQICPHVLLQASSAHDTTGFNLDVTQRTAALGLIAGYVAMSGKAIVVTPSASFHFVGAQNHYTFGKGDKYSKNLPGYGVLSLGVGVVVFKELTLVPTTTIPVRPHSEGPYYGISAAFTIGKKS